MSEKTTKNKVKPCFRNTVQLDQSTSAIRLKRISQKVAFVPNVPQIFPKKSSHYSFFTDLLKLMSKAKTKRKRKIQREKVELHVSRLWKRGGRREHYLQEMFPHALFGFTLSQGIRQPFWPNKT